MLRDKEGLLRELVDLKSIVDQFVHVFQKISVNPRAGENFANPVEVRLPTCVHVGVLLTFSNKVGSAICKVQCSFVEASPCSFWPGLTRLSSNGCLHWPQ
jgi:hypothetical protein